MEDINKELERAALHATIWRIANELRGSVDGWDFKQYVLGMLFYRFISENLSSYIDAKERRAGSHDFKYATLSDRSAELARKEIRDEKGFFIKPSELFENVRKRSMIDTSLNQTLETVFRNIERSANGTNSQDDMKGLFDDLDVNSNKLGSTVESRNKKLANLINAIGELKISSGGGV